MKSLRAIVAGGFVLAVASFAQAMTMIYPVEAIDDLWVLGAEEFKQKYSGINISGLSPSDEGWYIRYRHENLTYLFGPVENREDAQKKKWEMEAVRDAAIRNRATLASSQVDFVRFTYSGVFGRSGGNAPYDGSGPRISADGRSGPDGDMDGDGVPNALDDDMDGDGISNSQDGDVDGDGIPNGADDYAFGTNPADGDLARSADGRSGPDGDMDGDGTPNALDGDMDGDGVPNQQDGDADGDGVPNGSDDYAYGTNPAGEGSANDAAGRDTAAQGGQGRQQGGQDGSKQGGQDGSQQVGEQLASLDGSNSGQQGQQGQRRVASNQRGQQQSSQSGQSGQSGQQGQQSSSQSQSQSGSQGQPGQPSAPGSPSSPSGENPLLMLLRLILGL